MLWSVRAAAPVSGINVEFVRVPGCWMVQGSGIEGMSKDDEDSNADDVYEFIQTGDAYDLTLFYSHETDSYFMAVWGDVASSLND